MSSNEEYIRRNSVITVDDDKNTKLHYAAAIDNLDEIEKIIATGQKLDPENYLGWTPLMMGVKNANRNVIELLLRHGADATKRNKFGLNVFLISVTSGDVDIVELILEHLLCGGVSRRSLQKTISPISLAIMFSQSHIFRYLLERSFDPNSATPLTGLSPVMFAAAIDNHKAIKKLRQYKGDITQKNCLGKTASDILQFKHQKIDVDTLFFRQKPPQVPLIVVTSCNNSPYFQLTPPIPYNNPVGTQHQPMRKSSNAHTPNVCSPAVTPITSQFVPQMFFGPEFPPNQYVSPEFGYQSNDILNTNISPSTTIYSM